MAVWMVREREREGQKKGGIWLHLISDAMPIQTNLSRCILATEHTYQVTN